MATIEVKLNRTQATKLIDATDRLTAAVSSLERMLDHMCDAVVMSTPGRKPTKKQVDEVAAAARQLDAASTPPQVKVNRKM